MTNTLDKANINQDYIILKVKGEKQIKRRLMDLGLIPGTKLHVRKYAPLGDPIEIMVKGTELTIRKSDAFNILIETIAED
ncbi:MAG: ferrous iron transport protein A [Candidatus Izemoplasmatales bacterium]|nr:ferrous iron transport protein A [Candidatus Izemoplasmatales bacterium]MDY0139731.1 ferrous iron transport protein A [Candidatus Izemoplasmatales bacterium]